MRKTSRAILLIEDDDVDAMTVRRALKELGVPNRLVRMENGEAAVAFLRDADGDRPCIILLDLNMPIMNGVEFLEVVKRDGMLRRIPVVVLTTSDEEEDKSRSFDLGAAGYMEKPVDYGSFVEVMRSIDQYWTLSELPQ